MARTINQEKDEEKKREKIKRSKRNKNRMKKKNQIIVINIVHTKHEN